MWIVQATCSVVQFSCWTLIECLEEAQATYRAHDRQEPVDGHEDEGVDADVWRHVDEILHGLAPDQPERPVVEGVVGGGERDAEDDEEQVGHRQVEDQNVGGVAHRLVEKKKSFINKKSVDSRQPKQQPDFWDTEY